MRIKLLLTLTIITGHFAVSAQNGATITGLTDGQQICANAGPITITAIGNLNGTFSGSGVTDYGNGNAVLNPLNLVSGEHNILYSFSSLAKFSNIAVGEGHSVAINTDGSIWAWGMNSYGQLGDSTLEFRTVPTKINNSLDWEQVSANGFHTVAIKKNGTLWTWGWNGFGQLGIGSSKGDQSSPVQVGNDVDWASAVAGYMQTIAIKTDGTLWACGNGQYNMSQIGVDSDWNSLSAGYGHVLALKQDGTLWAWGQNYKGQLGDGTFNDRSTPALVITTVRGWQFINAGQYHSAAIDANGNLWMWGSNFVGQLGDGTIIDRTSPTLVSVTGWKSVKGGLSYTIALKTDGSLWTWGWNDYGQLGNGTTAYSQPIPLQMGTIPGWLQVAPGIVHTIALKSDSSLWAWGDNYYGQLGTVKLLKIKQITTDTGWGNAAAGWGYSIAIKKDGSIWSWGKNYNNELGDGTTVNKYNPEIIGNTNDWQIISCGLSHTIAIKNDHSLWAWGLNTVGQAGVTTTGFTQEAPIEVSKDKDWKLVSSKHNHNLAIKTDGSLWAWGNNENAQLGDGTAVNRKTPIRVGTITGYKSVAVGTGHSLAIDSTGQLWAWGGNGAYQLGDGTNAYKYTPAIIGNDKNWETVFAGYNCSYGIKNDGTLWAWGENGFGQLGNGGLAAKVPMQVGLDTNWKQVSGGYNHTFAIKTNGTLWAWGDNSKGQLGDGTTIARYSPIQIGYDTDWDQVSVGKEHTLAIKKNGSLWSCGLNIYGQLGDGTNSSSNIPVLSLASECQIKNIEFVESCTASSIVKKGSNWAAYPNPTTGEVYIKTTANPQGKSVAYALTDLTGKTVLNGYLNTSNDTAVDLSTLPIGIYLLKIEGEVAKVVKQ